MSLRTLPTWAMRLLQVVVLAALAVLLWRTVDWREAAGLLSRAAPGWIVLAVGLLTVQTVLSALRWRLTARRLGIVLPRGQAVREYYLSQVVNQSLPGGVLGDAGRAVRARGQAGLLASGQAVVFERIAGQLGLLALLGAGFGLSVLGLGTLRWPLAVAVPVAAGFAVIAGLAIWAVIQIRRPPADTSIDRSLRAAHHAVFTRHVAPRQAVLSLGTALCNIAGFAACAYALDVALPPLTALSLVPLILFAMVLPLSVAGWGLREGAAAVLFPLAGLSATQGVATSVAFGLVFLICVVPGLILSWMRPNSPGRRAPMR